MEENAVCVKSDNAVCVRKPQEEPSKSNKKILDEEEYIEVSLQSRLIFISKCLEDLYNKQDTIRGSFYFNIIGRDLWISNG